jgi:hypothetical protein
MTKALTVKVPVTKVIEALENKIAENQKIVDENEKIEREYPELLKKHSEQVLKSLKDLLTIEDINYYSWRQTLSVTYKISKEVSIPDAPRKETNRCLAHHELEEITNAIRILKMTEEEFVSTSTMKAIASYL